MSLFTPSTVVKLLNIPIGKKQEHQIKFPNVADQTAYMLSRAVKSFTDFTYARKDGVIKVNANVDTLYTCNYIMYNNSNFTNKWFYAFITRLEYISPTVTEVHIKTDVYQTWLFDLDFMESFVEREHVLSDDIGEHTIPENLETGEFTYNDSFLRTGVLSGLAYIIGVSDYDDISMCGLYGHVYSGVKYRLYEESDYNNLTAFIKQLTDAGKADAIVMIFSFPRALLPTVTSGSWIPYGTNGTELEYTFTTAVNDIDGFTPKNNKLFCYPFNQIYASNNNGSCAIYHVNMFTNPENIMFKVEGCVGANPTIGLTPTNYKGVYKNYEERLSLGGYPLCSWNNDVFANWFGQNKLSVASGLAVGALGVVGGAVTGNLPAVGAGAWSIANQLTSVATHAMQPDQAKGNTGGSDFNLANGIQDFSVGQMCIRKEYARRIDEYFTMYGYKIGRVKVPNMTGRTRFNYVKTIGANITAPIPQDDLEELKTIFDNGVTLWHDPTYVGDYSVENAIG